MYTTQQPQTADELIVQWRNTQKSLQAAKDAEMAMRKQVAATMFPNAKSSGTQTVELGMGWKLKLVAKQNYVVDKDVKKVDTVLDNFEDWQAERLVKWEGKLSVSEYKKLSDHEKSILSSILTIKDASPSLELVEPKGE